MELMQRIGSPKVGFEEYVKNYLDLIKANKGCCDNVWFASRYGYPKKENHKEYAEKIKKFAGEFRDNGIGVSLQLSNTIGHGEYMSSRDCSGLVYEGSPVENLVGSDGVVARYSFCWNGENFRKYIIETTAYYCSIEPDCLWIDDDLRAVNHAPVDTGCFCDNCIKKFNEQNGSEFNREHLVEEILHGDIKWRERWINFVREGLYSFTYSLCSEVHRLSPKTRIGYQHGPYGAYTGYGFDYIFKAMYDATGLEPYSRPGGSAYGDTNPNEFIEKAFEIGWDNAKLPSYVKNKTPEIESLPFMAFQKTNAGTIFETSLYFAYGNTDMSYSDMMNINEPLSWYDELFKGFAKNRKYWETMSDYNKGSYQAGMRMFISKNVWQKKLSPNEGIKDLRDEKQFSFLDFARTNFPLAYDSEEDSVILLHPDNAKDLSNEEIEYLLTKNVITDGETLALLKGRIDLSLEAIEIPLSEAGRVGEKYLEHPTLPSNLKTRVASFFVKGKNEAYRLIDKGANPEILSVYYKTVNGEVFPSAEKEYIAECIVKTKKGGTWAISGYKPWKSIMSSYHRDQFLNVADYISGNSLPARLRTMTPSILAPRKDNDGKVVCVSVANVSTGYSDKYVLEIRNPKTENFYYMAQGGIEIDLDYKKEGDKYLITLINIPAWTVCTVFCK